MARPFDHYLAIVFPGNLRQLAQRVQFGKLRFVVGIGDRAGPQTIAKRKRNIVSRHDLADVAEARVEKTFFMMSQTPLRHDRAATTNDARSPLRCQWNVRQTYA